MRRFVISSIWPPCTQPRGKWSLYVHAFYDQVTFLKHNLNARAIRSLKTTVTKLDRQVESLVQDIEVSMKHSDTFVQSLLAANAKS